jgi:polyhydroxyalkanoate synthesis regulator phasin
MGPRWPGSVVAVPSDEPFKRYLEIGASMLGMSRERAETIVRDLVASGELARSQATKAADWLVERGRSGSEELREMVRKEIRQQVAALGLATKDDVARLEARLDEVRTSAANAATPTTAAPAAPRARPAASATAKTAGRTAKAAKSSTTAKSATSAGATKSAGISRSASVRKRPGSATSIDADPARPGD